MRHQLIKFLDEERVRSELLREFIVKGLKKEALKQVDSDILKLEAQINALRGVKEVIERGGC